MKQNRAGLSQKYVAALGKNLKQGSQASLKPALELGRQAAVLGLETLDLARIHEQALATLKLSNVKNAFTKLAGIFSPRSTRRLRKSIALHARSWSRRRSPR